MPVRQRQGIIPRSPTARQRDHSRHARDAEAHVDENSRPGVRDGSCGDEARARRATHDWLRTIHRLWSMGGGYGDEDVDKGSLIKPSFQEQHHGKNQIKSTMKT